MTLNERLRADLILLIASAAWLALSATVVLWPAATIGLVILAVSRVQGTVPNRRALLRAVRRHLGAAYLWGLVNGAVLALVYALDRSDSLAAQVSTGLENVLKLVAALWLGLQLYALPLLLVQRDGRMLSAWRSALLLALSAPVSTLLVLGFAALGVGLTLAQPVPLALLTPGALALLGAAVVGRRLSAYGLPRNPPAP